MTAKLAVLVLEDEWPARNYLVELLQGSKLAEVVGAVATLDEAREALSSADVHIDAAFLDVQLQGDANAGLTLARSLSQTHKGLMLVLATAFERHAVEGYELGVVDYLLKPFSEERVLTCLERLVARRPHPPPTPQGRPRIVARKKKSLVFLEPHEIWAFEAADRLTFVHTAHGRFDLDLSLAAIEVSLGRALTRVHRNWLVNAAFIKELMRDGSETTLFVGETLADGGKGLHVPVSRDRAQEVKDALLQGATGLRRS